MLFISFSVSQNLQAVNTSAEKISNLAIDKEIVEKHIFPQSKT